MPAPLPLPAPVNPEQALPFPGSPSRDKCPEYQLLWLLETLGASPPRDGGDGRRVRSQPWASPRVSSARSVPLTCAAGDVGGSHWSESVTAGTQVAGELSLLLLVGAGWAGDTLLRLTVVIRALRAAD